MISVTLLPVDSRLHPGHLSQRCISVFLYVQILALFSNGRIEEWLDAITLNPEDMCNVQFIPRIASQLCRFHQLQLDLPCKAPNTPWAVIDDWLKQAKQLKFKDPQKQVCIGDSHPLDC